MGAALTNEGQADVRKTVTVVFCDQGLTALGERTDPEVLREVMAQYHAQLRAILERHGGIVEKFVGDAAMAIFGPAAGARGRRSAGGPRRARDAATPSTLSTSRFESGVNTGEGSWRVPARRSPRATW